MRIKFTKNRVIVILIILSTVLNLSSFENGHNWGGDFSAYIKQSQTIYNKTFAQLNSNIQQTDYILNYPWGYPLLLTPIISFFDVNINILKAYNYCFLIISFCFIFLYFKNDNKYFVLLTIMLISISPFFWEFKNNILSDFANLLFVYISLYFISEIYDKNKISFYNIQYILLGVILFLTFNMRSQSIILIPTLAVFQLYTLKKQIFKSSNVIKIILPYIAFLSCFILSKFINLVKAPTPYSIQFDFSIIKTIQDNIYYSISIWKELFDEVAFISQISEVIIGIFLLLFMIGILSDLKSNFLSIAFFLLSFLLILMWPYQQGLRFFIPLIPIFFYFSIKGLFELLNKFYSKYHKAIFHIIIGLVVVASLKSIFIFSINIYKDNKIVQGPYELESIEMFNYIKKNTKETDKIAFFKPRVMLLYSDRNSVIVDYTYKINKANYLVYYKVPTSDQIGLDSLQMLKLDICFENKNFKVFKLDNLKK